jgi:hypothetical protein
LQFQDDVVIRFGWKGGTRLALRIHNSNLEDCFRFGRNYTLSVTETVRGSELLHLTFRVYLAGDKNVKIEGFPAAGVRAGATQSAHNSHLACGLQFAAP